ncbi:MAG: hypothetical protein ACFFAO_17990, partial [Candidatus Hermodarchaeota archaeon]
NFFIFFFKLENPIFLIAFAYVLGTVLSCIISIILVIQLIFTEPKEEGNFISNKTDFDKIHKKYGTYLILADVFELLTSLIVYLLFLEFEFIIFITYLTICQISATSALLFSSSNPEAYIAIFSEIDYETNPKKYQKLFYRLNNFLMMFVCVILGIMLFYIEFYIVVIYSAKYLIILRALQLYLFTAFAQVIINNLLIITLSINKTKIKAIIGFIKMVIDVSFTIIALLFFDFYTLIFFYLISSFIMTFITVYLINKRTDFRLSLSMFYKTFIIFLISFIIVFPLNYIVNTVYSDRAYINFFINGTIKFSVFILIFYIFFYYAKVITKEEFNEMIEIMPLLNSKNRFIQWCVKKIIIFLPSKKK